MITLLKQEGMKAWKQNRVYYWFILALIVPILWIWRNPTADSLSILGQGFNVANLAVIVMAAVIFTQEFHFGTIRPLLSRRFSRSAVFTSKILTYTGVYLGTFFMSFVGTMIAWPIFVHHVSHSDLTNIWQGIGSLIFSYVLTYAFVTAFILLVANIVKSSGAAIGLGMVLLVGSNILGAFSLFLKHTWEPLKWNPFGVEFGIRAIGGDIFDGKMMKADAHQLMNAEPWVIFLVFAAYVLVLYAVTYYIFKRRSV
ncbi:ABC transporter permease [Eupransor demetentiae]|uniref:Permease component (NosY) n=1 Tax=Eupransor demetentiae TaxID=3109584 RepID=A0ABM9N7H1_9LACO|nr:ABC-type transport system involved in multi-copper enzyme maturation [Lactobacillaceae bacterium LMG 33000]